MTVVPGQHPPTASVWEPREPMTLENVIEALTKLLESRPKMAAWPVHILDMEPDDDPVEHTWDGLVTRIETDCFSEEQGMIVSLLAWRFEDRPPRD